MHKHEKIKKLDYSEQRFLAGYEAWEYISRMIHLSSATIISAFLSCHLILDHKN
jgi:hypothetical protein